MIKLLDYVCGLNFLKMGDYSFSPIMELSAGISLEYCKKLNSGKCDKAPLFFCFPEKKSASLWTAISILTNYYFEDHINNEIEGIKYNKGDKVKIFNSIGEVEGITKDFIFLKFKDQGGIPINKKLQSQLNKVHCKRSLSKKSTFGKNYRECKNNRNPISKILVPKDPETINQNYLESKVLLIAGRGNVKDINDLLNNVKIYNSPLSEIYPPGKNLIIKPDLKFFIDFFDNDELNLFEDFKNSMNRFFDILDINNAKEDLTKIIEKLDGTDVISEELDEDIRGFFADYESEMPKKIEFLEKKYPGVKESLPKKIRAVIINDISQIYEYPNAIKGFLEKKIPVIFISNRNVKNNTDFNFYDQLFENNPKYFRLNWNKHKIQELERHTNGSNYIDQGLWDQCKRYAQQSIDIDVIEGGELDILSPLLLSHIKDLDDFERLQKAFYTYFYPSLYALKNSMGTSEFIKSSIAKFNSIFDEFKSSIPLNIVKDFEKAISISFNFQNNTKHFEINENVFAQLLPIESDNKLFIPSEAISINLSSSESNKIIFTGYPFSEYSGSYLLNATCVDFVPEIKVLCWKNEASLTYAYLKRRTLAGYFTDNLEELVPLPDKYLLKQKSDFILELDNYLVVNLKKVNEGEEEDLQYLHTFKYKGYGIGNNLKSSFSVKCDIINFENGSFLFLPNSSKILAQTEDINGKLKVSKKAIGELNVGDKIFKYVKDRHAMRDIAKSNKTILSHLEKLEYWKITLEKLYIKCGSSVSKLKLLLDRTKKEYNLDNGNPSKLNIRNWLFDDEFLKPENENLRIILLANNETEIENKLIELDIAYQHVVSFTIGLSSKIKRQIVNQLSSKSIMDIDLEIIISGSPIIVQSRKILSIDKKDMEVDYINTRRILC